MPTSGDYEYTLSGTNATITKYNGVATDVVIPDTLDGYSVTAIGYLAFSNNTTITSVTIPNLVTTIEPSAFYGCGALTSVIIPDSVTFIGFKAFRGCTSLSSVTIGNSVTSIGGEAFYGCTSLTSVTIPESVTFIGDYVFFECTSITTIYLTTIPATINTNAFALGNSTTPVTCTVKSPNNIADGALDAYKNEYTTFVYTDYSVTYKKLLYDDSKVQVDSAIRDGLGNRIDTTYAKKGEGGSVHIDTGDGLTGGPITGTGTISHDTSGVTAGSYQEVTVDLMGHVTHGKKIFTFTHIYLEEED